ncbi:hypothetical protein C8K36_102166 [Rhodococcus sp. OK519]|uniref:DUF5715 family protein n=1 Tax=Rhodococcus sp. OK519 TaxID=2135729 RepID=UPI000D405BFC|nr:hypothetical protein C8K36_102166 [Rhodococcus sp. OK519]
MTLPAVDLDDYRSRVDDIAETIARTAPSTAQSVTSLLLDDGMIREVLSGNPRGADHAATELGAQVVGFVPSARSSAADLRALVRVALLHQIDVLWWGHLPAFESSADVLSSPALVDLDPLRAAGKLRFRYRTQPTSFAGRVTRAVERRVRPNAGPPSAGLRYARAAPESIALLNQIADEFGQRCAAAHPEAARAGIWLNSAVRSKDHQAHLASLGYAALEPSTHCSGLAVDIAFAWLRKTGGDRILEEILVARRDAGEVNVIDEGHAWHVCPSPASMTGLQQAYNQRIGF